MSTTYRNLQDEVLALLTGFGLEQPRTAYLSVGVTSLSTDLGVDDASSAQQGLAEIEGELVFIRSVDRTSNTITLSPDGRGYFGTTAAAHDADTRITFNPTWTRQRVKAAINDAIAGTWPTLFGVAQSQFTFTPAVTTYALPAEAEKILSVTADLNGPSREQQNVRHYQFNSVAPTNEWPNTNTISLHESVTPGRTVTVTYTKQPSYLSADTDLLTDSGLRETARPAIVYAAASTLTALMDVARLPVDTAQADELLDRNQPGMASRISGQLYQRYQIELEEERKRLRVPTPVAVSVRRR